MNKKESLALVRRSSSAVEKAVPGAKRILSDIVADMLALAKKEPPAKSVFTVLIGHRGPVGDLWEELIKPILRTRYDLRFFRFGYEGGYYNDNFLRTEFLELVAKQSCDGNVP